MKNISGKKLCKILQDNGWQLVRIAGSHYVLPKKVKRQELLFQFMQIKRLKQAY